MFSKPRTPHPADKETPGSSHTTRLGWTPLVCRNGDSFQMRILCQRSNGKKDLYSSAPSASKQRPTWPPVVECRFLSEQKGPSKVPCYEFVNLDNEKKVFQAELLNPLIYGTNKFTQKCALLILEQKPKLLSHYLTLTSNSEGFCSHTEDYDTDGFSKEDVFGLNKKDLIAEGGSIEDLKIFQTLAKEYAFIFNKGKSTDSNMRLGGVNKRKITEYFKTKPTKMTKTERIEKNFVEEMESETGLEKSLQKTFVSFKNISIDKLSVSPKLFLQMNDVKVKELMETMRTQFDPTQVILTVCPENVKEFSKDEKVGELNFYVIVGQHRLLALQGLDRIGKLEELPGINNRKIPCFVCKAESALSTNYANIRANDTASKFKNKANCEDLIFVYAGLAKVSNNSAEALQMMTRICHSRQTGAESLAALTRIVAWPEDILQKLMVVLESFQKFQTMDAGGYGARKNLRDKEFKSMTKEKFYQLGRCKPEYFAKNYEQVLDNKISLSAMLEESDKSNDLDETFSSISQVAGNDDIKSLKEKFGEKFDDERIVRYAGAKVYGKKKNVQGDLLKHYVKNVLEGKEIKEPIVVESIDTVFDVDTAKLDNFDVIIFNCAKIMQPNYIKYLCDYASCVRKNHFSLIVILPSESQLMSILESIDGYKSDTEFKVHQILFEKVNNNKVTGKVGENVTFALLFGRVKFFGGNLYTLQHGTVETELFNVVKKVSPPTSKVAFIAGNGNGVVRVHASAHDIFESQVTYYASKQDLEKFSKLFLVKAVTISDEVRSRSFKRLSERQTEVNREEAEENMEGEGEVEQKDDDREAQENKDGEREVEHERKSEVEEKGGNSEVGEEDDKSELTEDEEEDDSLAVSEAEDDISRVSEVVESTGDFGDGEGCSESELRIQRQPSTSSKKYSKIDDTNVSADMFDSDA